MIFTPTPLAGAFMVELDPHRDERGFMARAFCAREFEEHGLEPATAQCNLSFNHRAGTIRGMHYQIAPATETKFVRCVRGAVYDVIVDLRPDSPTYLHHVGVELSQENRAALFVPAMFAHGYQTLVDDSEVLYQVSAFYAPAHERGARFDDPAFGIEWPLAPSLVSPKDLGWVPFEPQRAPQ